MVRPASSAIWIDRDSEIGSNFESTSLLFSQFVGDLFLNTAFILPLLELVWVESGLEKEIGLTLGFWRGRPLT